MNQTTTHDPTTADVARVAERNRALRTTCCLLALSMVPTVLGARIGVTTAMATLSMLAIGIFSAFILHDLKRVQDGHGINGVTATLGVSVSLYNVFQSVLAVLGLTGGRDE